MSSEKPESKSKCHETAQDHDETRKRDDDDNIKQGRPRKILIAKRIHQCECDCANGLVDLTPPSSDSGEPSPPGREERLCQCTRCGPLDINGQRRCLVRLTKHGADISRVRNCQIICGSCRED